MKNNNSPKTENKSKSTSKKEVDKLQKFNISNLAERLSKVTVKEKKQKQHIYLYPEGFTEAKINSDEGKKFRASKRTALKRLCNNILSFAKTQQKENLAKEVKSFSVFYKEFYRVNDFSINSITNINSEKPEYSDYVLMLDVIKLVQK